MTPNKELVAAAQRHLAKLRLRGYSGLAQSDIFLADAVAYRLARLGDKAILSPKEVERLGKVSR